jgi:conjugative relaxase-like TrwC/TraI family protein
MVVSVAKATSADYYTGGDGVGHSAESYYLDAVTDGEPAGVWSGSGAARLGLDGEVIAEEMTAVYSEFINPLTGESIGFRPAERHSVEDRLAAALAAEPGALPERIEEIRHLIESDVRTNPIGWDATFSVAKSVTVAHTAAHRAELAALRVGDTDRAQRFAAIRTGIESAISEANTAMLDYAETITVTRTAGSAGAPTQWVAAPGLVVASFFQHTSRTIDPQLHTHNVILNRAFTADGKARSLDGKDLRAHKHALGAVADRVLEEALTAQGFEFELRPDGMARELTVIPTEVADLFSSRSRQISAKVAELAQAAQERTGRDLTDLELYYLKAQATLSTRTAKGAHAPETTEEMLDRWEAMTIGTVGSGLDRVAEMVMAQLEDNLQGIATGAPADWSPAAVLAEAVAACAQQRSAWSRADLTLEIARRAPSLGGLDAKSTVEVLERLTDMALRGPLVQQISGHNEADTAAADLLEQFLAPTAEEASSGGAAAALAANAFIAPSARLYASVDTLTAEEALRRAGIERGGHQLAADAVTVWLDKHTPTIGADQRAAVLGIAATDARLAILVGPAGTGKSFTAGAFANAWADLTREQGTPGRVTGLAVSTVATQVLIHDGVEHARNITQWLEVQDNLAAGSTRPTDLAWKLGPADVVMVDEASMVTTASLERIQALAAQAGARVVLTGDPRQLGAVEAGGVMDLMDGHAETYTLTDVRRFATEWEPAASLALRDCAPDALAAYDRHGRLLAHDTTEDAVTAAARAAVADRLDGRSVVVVTGSNEQANAIATSVRNQLVELGLVQEDGVLLGLDGCTAGVGDLISARQNDYSLGVFNRAQYRVTAVGDDGSLTVQPTDRDGPAIAVGAVEGADPAGADRQQVVLPAAYVGEHVQLGYASTAHAAQGLTVDAAHLVTDGSLDAAALYVGMSRGRLRNTAHVGLNTTAVLDTRPTATTENGGEIRLEGDNPKPTARVVLEGSLDRSGNNRAATVEAELDAERLSNLTLLAGRYEAVVRAACRERLERHLDDLTATGVLDETTRTRLGADQGTEHLSRLLRAVEQAGQDPHEVLTTAITDPRGFTGVDSVAQILSHRITGGQPLPHPTTRTDDDATAIAEVPGEVAPQAQEHLRHLKDRMDQRCAALGERLADDAPPWALEALGPVPQISIPSADSTGDGEQYAAALQRRAEWVRKAGIVAGHREATSWDDPHRPLGPMPGLAATERRASYTRSWDALGRPEAGLDEAAMTEGQLRVRVRVMRAELAWAPPHADTALRAAETAHEQARQDAALARARADYADQIGDSETAAQALADAAEAERAAVLKAAAIEILTISARGRSVWAGATAEGINLGTRAETELRRRGIDLGQEPDLTSSEDWLSAEREAIQAEDDERPITETDLHNDLADHQPDYSEATNSEAPTVETDAVPSGSELPKVPPSSADLAADEVSSIEQAAFGTGDRLPSPIELVEPIVEAGADVDEPAPAEQPEAVAESAEPADDAVGSADQDAPDIADPAGDEVDGAEQSAPDSASEDAAPASTSAAHQVLPEDASAAQLEAAASITALALQRARDRASQEAAHASDADLDDTADQAGAESPEAGRRRRDSADQQAAAGIRENVAELEDQVHGA